MPRGVYNRKNNHGSKGKRWKVKDTSKVGKHWLGKKRPNLSEETKRKIGLNQRGNKNHNFGMIDDKSSTWKGDGVGYRGLHYWVIKKLGKAQKCEHCGKEKTTPRSMGWANKGHTYKRNLTDWISLCVSCHARFDGNRGRRKQSKI